MLTATTSLQPMVFYRVASCLSWEPFQQAIELKLSTKYLDMIWWDASDPEHSKHFIKCKINKGVFDKNCHLIHLAVGMYVDDVLVGAVG